MTHKDSVQKTLERMDGELPAPWRDEEESDFKWKFCSEMTAGGMDDDLAAALATLRWYQYRRDGALLDRLGKAIGALWQLEIGQPLGELHYTGSGGPLGGAVGRKGDGYRVIAQKRATVGDMLFTLLHEMGHAKRGMHGGEAMADISWDTLADAARGEPTASAVVKAAEAAQSADDANEEAICDRLADVWFRLWGDPILTYVYTGDRKAINKQIEEVWTAKQQAAEQKAAQYVPPRRSPGLDGIMANTHLAASKAARRAVRSCKAIGSTDAAVKAINARYGTYSPGGKVVAFGEGQPGDMDVSDIDAADLPEWVRSTLKRHRKYVSWVSELRATGALPA